MKSDGLWGYTYDANGNLVEKGKGYTEGPDGGLLFDINQDYFAYQYDLLNRMSAVYKADTASGIIKPVADYAYDAVNLRVKKTGTDQSVEPGATYFIYGLGGQVLYEESPDGTSEYVFVYGRHFAVINTDADTGAETRYYYLTDHLGSTVGLADEAGALVWADELTPFGSSSGSNGVLEGQIARYTGKDLDKDSELYYFNARWYDSDVGRFVSVDPIKDGINWYGYCGNNPLVFTDPWGLEIIVEETYKGYRERVEKDLIAIDPSARVDRETGQVYFVDADTTDYEKGHELLKRMADNKNTVTIKFKKDASRYEVKGQADHSNPAVVNAWKKGVGTDSTVYYDPFMSKEEKTKHFIKDYETGRKYTTNNEPPFIALAHELIHADHIQRGVWIDTLETTGTYKGLEGESVTDIPFKISIEELKVLGIEYTKEDGKTIIDSDDININQIRHEAYLNHKKGKTGGEYAFYDYGERLLYHPSSYPAPKE